MYNILMPRSQKPKPQLAKSETISELPKACADEAAAIDFFERKRWGGTPACVHCGSVNVYQMKDRTTGERSSRFLWRCRDCKRQFTVRVGTIFEDSAIPMHKWARAFWEAASAKNGVSALELMRKLEISYKSALFVMHRLRHAMADTPSNPPKLTETVESDETYVGGKPRYKGWNHGNKHKPREKYTTKTPVIAVLQRGGSVRTRVMPVVNSENVRDFLTENVDNSARLITDSSYRFRRAATEFPGGHETVNHTGGEYVRGDVTTNGIESYFARVKRTLNGTYHAVSKEHLFRYMDQVAYLYNTRGMNDGERTLHLIRRADGKRLMRKDPA